MCLFVQVFACVHVCGYAYMYVFVRLFVCFFLWVRIVLPFLILRCGFHVSQVKYDLVAFFQLGQWTCSLADTLCCSREIGRVPSEFRQRDLCLFLDSAELALL